MDYLADENQIELAKIEELQELEQELESQEGGQIAEAEVARTGAAAWFLSLAGLATVLPFVIHLQFLSGPIVNALLILILFLVGIRAALLVALIPSLMALAGGLLPAVLAPAVPFIMISNALYILVIDQLYNRLKNEQQGFWLGVMAGSAIKFIFLFFSVNLISGLLIKSDLAPKVVQMMSWPQLATALAGGAIAWAVLKWLKRI